MDRSITLRVIAVVLEGSHNITRDKNTYLGFTRETMMVYAILKKGKHPPKTAEVRALCLPCNDVWTVYFPRLTAGLVRWPRFYQGARLC